MTKDPDQDQEPPVLPYRRSDSRDRTSDWTDVLDDLFEAPGPSLKLYACVILALSFIVRGLVGDGRGARGDAAGIMTASLILLLPAAAAVFVLVAATWWPASDRLAAVRGTQFRLILVHAAAGAILLSTTGLTPARFSLMDAVAGFFLFTGTTGATTFAARALGWLIMRLRS